MNIVVAVLLDEFITMVEQEKNERKIKEKLELVTDPSIASPC